MSRERGRGVGVRRAIKAPFSALFQLVFGSGCLLCGQTRPDSALCQGCAAAFQRLGQACCAKCGKPRFEPSAVASVGPFVCGECLTEKRHFDHAVSTFLYEGRMRDAILTFKYRKRFRIGGILGTLLAHSLPPRLKSHPATDETVKPDVVIPVPLHISRLREREFNQSAILAKHLSEALDLPTHYSALERIRATEFQSMLSPSRRVENVRNAFKVTSPKAVSGAHVLLVDDIFTHGATANECAKALKKAGAESVVVATLATPPLGHSVDGPDDEDGDPAS
ncbi:MAG: ComF family protein [Candidatus Coatesbacteria bacterium]|nr:ComF family protein [Candidatus Coatesbacteria bacterium]